MQTEIAGIIFDKDGTLFDFQASWSGWTHSVLADLAHGDDAVLAALAEVSGYDLNRQSFKSGSLIVIASVDEIVETWREVIPQHSRRYINDVAQRHLEEVPSVPVCDLDRVLGGLRRSGLTLGIATNDYHASAVRQLRQAGAAHHFDFVAGFDSGHGAKPAPGMLRAFCSDRGLRPAQVAMVGDSTHDLQAGIAAGVGLTIGVLTGPAVAEDLVPYADAVLDDISDLPEFLAT